MTRTQRPTNLYTPRIDLPAGRRMPPPSRLPEMDLEGLSDAPARRPAGLVHRIAQAIFRR